MQDVVQNNHFLTAGLHRGNKVHQANAANLVVVVASEVTDYADLLVGVYTIYVWSRDLL